MSALYKVFPCVCVQIKSMAEHLSSTESLCAPRQMRFPSHFVDDVQSLVHMLTKDIVERYNRVGCTFSCVCPHILIICGLKLKD